MSWRPANQKKIAWTRKSCSKTRNRLAAAHSRSQRLWDMVLEAVSPPARLMARDRYFRGVRPKRLRNNL
ncbi:MAG: hypothetical protein C0404_12705 [Verrucomicrobia bacterium]|nr:hypothetical protein [Verrucomicrobiota bacterium]